MIAHSSNSDISEFLLLPRTIEVNRTPATHLKHLSDSTAFTAWSTTLRCIGVRPWGGSDMPGNAAVVVEATYGVSNHLPREGREQRLLSRVRAILKGGGRCLLPVVALGRAQVPLSCFAPLSVLAGTVCRYIRDLWWPWC